MTLADFIGALGASGSLIVAFFVLLIGTELVRFAVYLVANGGRW